MSAARLIIFDCDGVLVNSEEIYQAAELEALASAGIIFEPSAYAQEFMGLSPVTWRTKLESVGLENAKPLSAEFFERMSDYTVDRLEEHLAALPGAWDTIKRLPSLLCVASSTPFARLRWKLERTGLLELFDPNIFSSDMVENGKPAPDLFLHAASAMRVHPSDSIVVEDSANGVLAGKAAGMRVVGFVAGKHCGGDHGSSLLRAGADMIVSDYRGLEALLS
jgi:HAD superfamily hydrolase (TIGR01509 family)